MLNSFTYEVIVCLLSFALCPCVHALVFFSVTVFQSTSLTAVPHIPQPPSYPTFLTRPVPLPGFPASCFAHPPKKKKTCVLKLQCVQRHCGKPFPPAHSLDLPSLSSPHSATVWDRSGEGLFEFSLNCQTVIICN